MNVELARWQFAFVTVNHFFFVPVTIGLAFLTALLQTTWYRTKRDEYLRLTRFFGTLLVINVAIGVVTGLVQEFQFGAGFAFAATTVTIASCIVAIFTGLYPNVMVSTTNAAYNLTARNTASAAYSLKVMTVVAIILVPIVLAYQTWTYYVFRQRVSKQQFQASPAPSTPPGPRLPAVTQDAAPPSAGGGT